MLLVFFVAAADDAEVVIDLMPTLSDGYYHKVCYAC